MHWPALFLPIIRPAATQASGDGKEDQADEQLQETRWQAGQDFAVIFRHDSERHADLLCGLLSVACSSERASSS